MMQESMKTAAEKMLQSYSSVSLASINDDSISLLGLF